MDENVTYNAIDPDVIITKVRKAFQSTVSFNHLIEVFQNEDKLILGKLPINKFTEISLQQCKNKITKDDILNFARIFKKINYHDEVFYHEVTTLIYENATVDNFKKCIEYLKSVLKNDCNNDLFLFFVKMNNMNNSAGMNKNLTFGRLYEFFRGHVELLHPSVIKQFDLDHDGVVNFDDMTKIIITYIDKDFFNKKK